jgi:tRNA pseudouridine13 synthase
MTNALPRGRVKDRPEDFVVEEIPAYEPSGAGPHLYVRFTKRDRTTLDAVRDMARALSCDPRNAGYAGMKDKRALATQTVSLLVPRGVDSKALAARARELKLDGIVVHDATPHDNKLKPGHLRGNRFAITVRGIDRERVAEVARALDRVSKTGVPNAFGTQRFGVGGDNATRALAWLRGEERGPRDPRAQRLLWSSLQSAVFNEVLDLRVRDGSWAIPLEGDLLKLHASGGLFVCTTVQLERERAERGEVSPTGPIIGARMRAPEGAPGELEGRVACEVLGDGFDLERTRRLGEGSRRALRMWVQDLRYEIVDGDANAVATSEAGIRVCFVLPKGGYATTVLAAAISVHETEEPRPATSPSMKDRRRRSEPTVVDEYSPLYESTEDDGAKRSESID